MPARRDRYKTVSDELVECAERTERYFRDRGYSIRIEKYQLGFPYTPTFLCKLEHITLIVEVVAQVSLERLQVWIAYAQSCRGDTRVAISLARQEVLEEAQEQFCRDNSIAVYVSEGQMIRERMGHRDLALHVQLPKLALLKPKLRGLLGPAYVQFEQGNWREGFENACQAFEVEVKKYLKKGIQSKRIIRGPRVLPARKIDRMPMGALKDSFFQIQNMNGTDSIIAKTLQQINPDRVGVAHHRAQARTETRLRRNFGQHMWAIVAAMKLLV